MLKLLRIFLAPMIIASVLADRAEAHVSGESYIYLTVGDAALGGRYEIPVEELLLVFDLDADGDGLVSMPEMAQKAPEIFAHFEDRISFSVGDDAAGITFTGFEFFEPGPPWVKLAFDVDRADGSLPDEIGITHQSTWDEANPNHRVLVLIESNTRTGVQDNEVYHALIFEAGRQTQTLNLGAATFGEAFSKFLWHGLHHLLIGFDHIAFLLALVLPSVLIVRGDAWAPAPNFRVALWTLVKIATTFTIAHSVTLGLAVLGWVRIPASPVEALIAASIVGAALANILLVGRKWVYPVVFLLGLLHGLGFANVFAPLRMEPVNIVPSLFGFNVGVEIGQIAILIVPFGLLFALRNWPRYERVVLTGGSGVLVLVALYWFGERAIGVAMRLMGA